MLFPWNWERANMIWEWRTLIWSSNHFRHWKHILKEYHAVISLCDFFFQIIIGVTSADQSISNDLLLFFFHEFLLDVGKTSWLLISSLIYNIQGYACLLVNEFIFCRNASSIYPLAFYLFIFIFFDPSIKSFFFVSIENKFE